MARIANPIYDAAFKYLMDEPRVANVFLRAIENKDVGLFKLLLTLFDQSKQDPDDHHVINYNISDYDINNDELHDDMSFMVRRLEQATANEEMIIQMCLEDKIEEIVNGKRDADEKLAEQAKMLQEKDSQIQEKDSQLQEYKNEVEKLHQLLKQHGISPS